MYIEYCILREGVPFSLKSIRNIITEERKNLLSLIYEEIKDNLDFRVKFDIQVPNGGKTPR